MHKQQGWPQAWEYSQAKLIKHLGELHKEWTEAGVSASRVTTLRCLQEKGYQATSEPKTTSEASYLGCGEKELDCCSVVQSPLFRWKKILHFIWKSRSQSLEEEWRGTESMLLEVQCEVSTVSDDLGCHVICWCWSTVFSEVHSQRSHLPSTFMKMLISFSSRTWHLPTLPKVPKAGSMTMVLLCLICQQTWPEPHRESERHQTQQCMMTWRPLSKKPGLPYHLSSATNWSPPCHAELRQ